MLSSPFSAFLSPSPSFLSPLPISLSLPLSSGASLARKNDSRCLPLLRPAARPQHPFTPAQAHSHLRTPILSCLTPARHREDLDRAASPILPPRTHALSLCLISSFSSQLASPSAPTLSPHSSQQPSLPRPARALSPTHSWHPFLPLPLSPNPQPIPSSCRAQAATQPLSTHPGLPAPSRSLPPCSRAQVPRFVHQRYPSRPAEAAAIASLPLLMSSSCQFRPRAISSPSRPSGRTGARFPARS